MAESGIIYELEGPGGKVRFNDWLQDPVGTGLINLVPNPSFELSTDEWESEDDSIPAFVNVLTNPSFEVDTSGWTVGTWTIARVNTWAWSGAWSARLQGTSGGSVGAYLLSTRFDVVPGKQLGARATINVAANPAGIALYYQFFNSSNGFISGGYMQNAPRGGASYSGTGEWEIRGLTPAAPSNTARAEILVVAQGAGAYDFTIDAILASQTLVDRNVQRPGEGLDVSPYGDGDDPEWLWTGTPHASPSQRRNKRVNWVRNPSVAVDASLLAGFQTDASLTVDSASRFTPNRIEGDGLDGSTSAEWKGVASPTGHLLLYMGDPANLVGTATPVSNQEVSIAAGSIKVMTPLPAGALVYMLAETYSRAGTRQYGKGYSVTPPLQQWQQMAMNGLEEFPVNAGANNVPNTPPRWMMPAFWITGLTPGATYTFRTDRSLARRSTLQTKIIDQGYFDGDFSNSEWLGIRYLSASRRDIAYLTQTDEWSTDGRFSMAYRGTRLGGTAYVQLRTPAPIGDDAVTLGVDVNPISVPALHSELIFTNASGAEVSRAVGASISPVRPTRLWQTARRPAGATHVRPRIVIETVNTNIIDLQLLLDSVQLTRDPVEFFTGSSHGARWTGQDHRSTSERTVRPHRSNVYKLDDVTGLTPSVRTSTQPRTGQHGVRRGRAAFEGLEPVLDGTFIHSGPDAQETMRRQLVRVAHSILNEDGKLRWLPSDAEPNEWREITVRLLDRIDPTGGLFKEFQLPLMSERPFILGTEVHREFTSTLATGGAGGLKFPLKFPINFIETVGSGVGTFHNSGENESPPIVRIHGPILSPITIRNNTSLLQVVLNDLSVARGQYVELDMYEETITLNGNRFTSLMKHLEVQTSEFFYLVPGDNSIQLIGSNADSNSTRAEVEWKDSYG